MSSAAPFSTAPVETSPAEAPFSTAPVEASPAKAPGNELDAMRKEMEAMRARMDASDKRARAAEAKLSPGLIATDPRDVLLLKAAQVAHNDLGGWGLQQARDLIKEAGQSDFDAVYADEHGAPPRAHGWPCTTVMGQLVCLKHPLPAGNGLPTRWAAPDRLDKGPL